MGKIFALLQKYQKLIRQFSRFLGIGFLNTGVDYSIINILIAATAVAKGPGLAAMKVVSFSIAVTHSYFWNKYWAFMKTDERFFGFLVKVAGAGLLGVCATGLAIFGSGKEYSWLYFVVILAGLFIGEVILWNSFGLNKVAAAGADAAGQFTMFITVSVIGALFAAGIVWVMTSAVQPFFGMNPRLWANIANAISVCFVLFWNFFGYKLLVFKK